MSRQHPLDSNQARFVTEVLNRTAEIKRTAKGPAALLACMWHDLVAYTAAHGMPQDAYLFAMAVAASIRGVQEEASEAIADELLEDAITEAKAEPAVADFLKGTTITAWDVLPNVDPLSN